jgi:hypothetical protein
MNSQDLHYRWRMQPGMFGGEHTDWMLEIFPK